LKQFNLIKNADVYDFFNYNEYIIFTAIINNFNNLKINQNKKYLKNIIKMRIAHLSGNYLLNFELFYKKLLCMFIIKSNNKQYFLSFLGLNTFFFKTVSTGKILSRKNLKIKSLKKSKKAYKYIFLFFKSISKIDSLHISHCLLKPINRKNLNMFYLILKNCKTSLNFLGFYHYYKISVKTVRRIKKKIKKKLLANHTYYS